MLLHTLLSCMHHILQVAGFGLKSLPTQLWSAQLVPNAAVPQANHVMYFPHLTTPLSEYALSLSSWAHASDFVVAAGGSADVS
jgi:hypothetical protein